MQGLLQSDVADAKAEKTPPEYRDLVKRYFHEVARKGSEEEKEK
jgi:hypothetical protein